MIRLAADLIQAAAVLACRLTIVVAAEILRAVQPETPDFQAWAAELREPVNYCLRCGIPHTGDCLREDDE